MAAPSWPASSIEYENRTKRCVFESRPDSTSTPTMGMRLAAAIGWDLDTALDRVHESNMSKLEDGKPIKDEFGKIQKSRNYQPPSLLDLA